MIEKQHADNKILNTDQPALLQSKNELPNEVKSETKTESNELKKTTSEVRTIEQVKPKGNPNNSNQTDIDAAPVAPPRRKKKKKQSDMTLVRIITNVVTFEAALNLAINDKKVLELFLLFFI